MFKALADAHRRTLLDVLSQQDGQTLSALCDHLPMTRFGVMKHLQILEEAGLITTRRIGREKFHYLNPVPIQMVYDRWVSKYARPWTQTLTGLKYTLESETMSQKPDHVLHTYIRTTPERVWQALIDGEMTAQYYYASRVESDWKVDSPYRYLGPDGRVLIEGTIIEIDPPRRLVTTFRPLWVGEAEGAAVTQVTWEIEPAGDACKLTLTHAGLEPGHPLSLGMIDGWARIVSGLKTLLETGEPLALGS